MWGTETGSQVMKRIAAPMVGGLVSSAVLTLVIIPAVYFIWMRWQLRGSLLEEPRISVETEEVMDEGD
jgi:Cu(I)/Ag(I) efflux system membrane protein CusA/SilA